ncbi:hypothetical protein STEG23_030569 [Scotinomys teguina]
MTEAASHCQQKQDIRVQQDSDLGKELGTASDSMSLDPLRVEKPFQVQLHRSHQSPTGPCWCGQRPSSGTPENSPCPHPYLSPLEERPQSLPRTQEHPDAIGPGGPRSTQTLLDQEDPEAPQMSLGQEDSRAPRPHWTKSPSLAPLSEVEMGQRQCKSTYNNIKNKTSPEPSPPSTPTPEHCNVDKAEEKGS